METKARKVHFMGIAGAGVSAVAVFAKANGYSISGCDLDIASPFLNNLKKEQVELFDSHFIEHLSEVDILVISPAIISRDPDNPELVEAQKRGIQVLIGEEFLAKYILGSKKLIAVSGTHGKSTTTSMVGKILEDAGKDPSVLVGALVEDWGSNYRIGQGDYFVLEADEYQEKFLLYHPFILVITAIEMDHPEYFKDETQVRNAFEKLTSQVDSDGKIVLGRDVKLEVENSIPFEQKHFALKLIGDFNQDNASLAAKVGQVVGIAERIIKESLERFTGVGRRFELKGEEKGVKVFEDYAHHPTAIKVTSEAAREKFPENKIWLVFQPHMYSRTAYLRSEFIKVFQDIPIDHIVLVDIFAAREENKTGITSLQLVAEIGKENVKYLAGFEETSAYLAEGVSSGDVVIVMGAGDIYKLSEMVLKKIAEN